MLLTRDYYLKKSHLYKKRYDMPLNTPYEFIGQKPLAIVSLKLQKFEFVYIRSFKKYLRKSYCKSKMHFYKPKFWIRIFPNFILSKKSKNSRMGAGVGQYIRLVMRVFPNTDLLWLTKAVRLRVIKVIKFLIFKTKLQLKILQK